MAQENPGLLARLKIALGRIRESEDDELAFAFYVANAPEGAVYDRPTYTTTYMARAYPLYQPDHVERMVAMVFRACGFTLSTFTRRLIKRIAHELMQVKLRRAQNALEQSAA